MKEIENLVVHILDKSFKSLKKGSGLKSEPEILELSFVRTAMTTNTTESSYFEDDASFGENSFKELLEPIIFPAGVSSESLAKIIAAIILRKSYLCSSAWSKWILLAALDELLGKPVPILNEKQLREIQGNQFEDSAVTSSGIGFETEMDVSPPSMRFACVNVCNCSNSISTAPPFCSSVMNESEMAKNFKDLEENEKETNDERFSSCKFGWRNLWRKNTKPKIALPLLSRPPKLPEFYRKQSGAVLSSAKDCLTSSTQTESISVVDKAVLTDRDSLVHLSSAKNCLTSSTQTESISVVDRAVLTDLDSLVHLSSAKDCLTSSTQTESISVVDRAVLTDRDSLVCLKRLCLLDEDQTSYENEGNISIVEKSTQTENVYRLIKISGISKSRTRKQFKSNRYIISGEQVIKLFYGKPRVRQTSPLQTPIIPLEPIGHYYGLDPRICSSGIQTNLSDLSEFTERRSSSVSASSSPYLETQFKEDFNSSKETSVSESFGHKRKRSRCEYSDMDAVDNSL
ncbi:hypothetical protein Avbf_03280 [Armadillidium vulgare]|nr:hypothetical protein Avbf_03280 [Armadillidium vulgare]